VDAGDDERRRMLRNFSFYDGVDDGQWEDKSLLAALKEQGKPAHTFNWVQNLVDTVVGHLKQEPVGVRFLPEGQGPESRDVLQALYDMDYFRGNFQRQFDAQLRDALVFQGVIQVGVTYEDDRLGNVDLRALNPKHVVRDPYWNSTDIKDCRAVMVYSWLTAEQIKSLYDTKAPEVDEAIERYAYDTQQNNPTEADRSQPYYDEDGSLYKVIEVYYMEPRKVRRVLDISMNKEVDFDMEPYVGHADEVLKGIVQLENPDWRLVKETEDVCRVVAFAPGISQFLLLEDADYPLQFKRLPFVFLSYKTTWETRQGLVDKLVDAQVIFNKRQSMVSHALGGSAGAGNWIVEKGVFGGDEDRKADFEARISMNGQVLEVNDEALREKRMQEVQRGQLPLDILKSTEEQRNYLNDLAMITPGMMGYAEQADESGALYRSKVRQAMIGMEMLSDSIKDSLIEIGKLYVSAAREVYSGPSRRFVDKETNQEFWINRMMVDRAGNVVPVNIVSDLPDHLVKLEEKRIGKNRRDEEIQMQISLLQYVKNPVLSAALEGMVAENLELGEEKTAILRDSATAFMKMQAAMTEAQRVQAEMMAKQAAQPQAPAGPPGAAPAPAAPAASPVAQLMGS
jgi:hypothetical protein